MNICPVCGFGMKYPPADFNICPSCGTEFGYDDSGTSYDELRARWFRSDLAWWSPVDPRPKDWNPLQQLVTGLYLNARPSKPVNADLWLGAAPSSIPTKGVRRKRKSRKATGQMLPWAAALAS